MTYLTALRIQSDEVEVLPTGPDETGKYGFYIGTYDESPSGNKRPLPLLTSTHFYTTPEEALKDGHKLVKSVKETQL